MNAGGEPLRSFSGCNGYDTAAMGRGGCRRLCAAARGRPENRHCRYATVGKRAQFVCHTILAEPAPPSLGRLIDLLMDAKDRPRSRLKNREKYYAAVRFVAKNPGATVSRIKRKIDYDQPRTIKRWLADPEFQDAVEHQRLENKVVQGG